MEKIKICFIGTSPYFNGGVSVLQKNLINYIKKTGKQHELTWVYPGKGNKEYIKEDVNYVELKVPKIFFLEDILFNLKAPKFIKKRKYDIINSNGIWGLGIGNYKKGLNQKIIHTYHGTAYNLLKNSSKRFGILKKTIFFPTLVFGYFMEKFPLKKSDRVICVSEKVKKEVQNLYGRGKNIVVIRTGVNLKDFMPRNKNKIKDILKLDKKRVYGLYVGHGGFWTKGLDRAVKLSEELYKKNNNYRLIAIGPERKKVKHLINRDFVIYMEDVNREKMPFYYNATDIFFCMSRYEGGAPTLVVSEAMASGCLIVFSKSSEQEIIENGKNGLVINDFNEKDAEKIINILNDKNRKEKIIANSLKTIKELSLEKWGKKYLRALME